MCTVFFEFHCLEAVCYLPVIKRKSQPGLLKNMHNGLYKISGLPKFCILESSRLDSEVCGCLCTFDFILTDRFIM